MKIFITIQTFSTVVFTVWLLYVWIKDSNFGSQPQCNHLVKYVLLFADVKVTMTWLRVLFIIYLVINACTLLFRFGVILSVYMENLRNDLHDKVRNVVTGPGAERVEQPEQENVRQEANPERRVRTYVNLSVVYVPRTKSPASFSNFLLIRSAVYGVATLELIVRTILVVKESMLTETPGQAQSSEHSAWRRRVGFWANHRHSLDFRECH